MNSPAPPLLSRLTSPTSMAVVFGLFATYALIRLLVFPWVPLPDATNPQPILLGSQFAMLLCLVTLIRAFRDGRIFDCFFVVLVAVPAVSIATNVALMASFGMKVDMESIKRSSFLFSPLVWIGLGAQGVLLGAILLWQRWKKV